MKSYFQNKVKPVALCCSLLLFSQGAFASQSAYEVTKTCTLSQSILKEHILLGMDVTYTNPEREIVVANKKIFSQLAKLKKITSSKKVDLLNTSWKTIDVNIKKKLSKENVLAIYTEVEAFNKGCQLLAKELKTKNSDKLQIASLNLEVQTLAALYAIKSWGAIDDDKYKNDVEAIINNYSTIFKALSANKGIDKKSLAKIKKDFKAFKFLVQSDSGRYMPVLAEKKSSSIDNTIIQLLEEK